MGDLSSALNTAFDEEIGSPEPASTPEAPATEAEPVAAVSETPESPEAASVHEDKEAGAGDDAYKPLSNQEIAELRKANPGLYATYQRLSKAHTQASQERAELRKELQERRELWDALNNPETRRPAVEALARAVGIEVKPTDQPQRDKAAEVADNIAAEWAEKIGPEAAQVLRPLIERTALAAVQGTIQPLQQAIEMQQQHVNLQSADSFINRWRSESEMKGLKITPELERKVIQIGSRYRRPGDPWESAEQAVKFLHDMTWLARQETAESDIEKHILERMNKAAQTAEPARGIPSTGREKRSNITKEMGLNEAMDVAFEEVVPGLKMG